MPPSAPPAAAVAGREVGVVGHTAWMDAAILSAAGVPTVVFGPGGEGAHAVEEWVDLGEVEQCARTLAAVAAGSGAGCAAPAGPPPLRRASPEHGRAIAVGAGRRGQSSRNSRSFAQRGSGSRSWWCSGPAVLRFAPHSGHSPAQSGVHTTCTGSASA